MAESKVYAKVYIKLLHKFVQNTKRNCTKLENAQHFSCERTCQQNFGVGAMIKYITVNMIYGVVLTRSNLINSTSTIQILM